MADLTRSETVPARVAWGWRSSHARRALLATAGIALLIAAITDRWYSVHLEAQAREDVRAVAQQRAEALLRAATREVSLLSALTSFAGSRRTRAQLDAEFPTFVAGVMSGRGVRALQLVEGNRIVAVWPLEGNEAALGLELNAHPDSRVRDGQARAMVGGRTTITGPVALVQGGLGLIVRQRLAPRPGFPDLAAVVLDVPDLVATAGIPDPSTGLRMELYDRSGRWFAGDPAGTAVAPETIPVVTSDGTFRLQAAPIDGWAMATSRWRLAMRGVLALSVVALILLAWLVGRRRDDLEAEVRRSGTALELVMRSSRMGGWEEDLSTGAVRWNSTIDSILGRPSGAAVDGFERLADAVEPADRPRLAAALARARGGDATGFIEEVQVQARGGEPRWVLVLGDVARDTAGRPSRIFGVVADSTERHALQARVRHAQRLEALGKLAGGVAHDFNNLLTAIGAFGELAHGRAGDLAPESAAQVRADLDQVISSARRGGALTQQLLTFSRGREVERHPIDVGATIAELRPTLAQLIPAAVRIEFDLAPSLPRVRMDAGQLTQVLTNLVVNARDALPDGGTIRVRAGVAIEAPVATPARSVSRWVLIEVRDDGVGMSTQVRERIFEPYFTTKPMGRGTGLGLAVVYGIVDTAGGAVSVQSAEGRGTTFSIHLPAAEDA